MTPDDILEQLRQKPFAPFRIHTSNGRSVDVRHSEMIAVSGESSAVADGPQLRVLSLVTITELEVLPSTAA